MIIIKRIVLLIASILLITGCNMKNDTSILNEFKDSFEDKTTYNLKGTMSIISNEDEFAYDIDVSVKDKKYYKVLLKNTISNNEQIILKNDDGVYVVTPSNNKSFKFTSKWPDNSSQAYLLECLLNDVLNDEDVSTETNDKEIIINSKVNYPNNENLVSETIYMDKKYNLKKVDVKDKDNNVMISIKVGKLDYKPDFKNDYFDLVSYINEEKEDNKDGKDTDKKDKTEKDKSTIAVEDIVYPLYVPSDTYLSSKDTVDTSEGNRVILTFAGSNPFILVEEKETMADEMEVIPVSGEPMLIGGTIAVSSTNSLYWNSNGIDFYLTGKNLDVKEMMMLAESIQNSTYSVASTK